ncbi:putative transcriptional regulator [Rhodoblastus acidophilus]|uniref:MucR family transcriptional regulator n=1 Tax=Rhodoblastus acidophilus TaxID=1074 RepID=UPI002224A72A|nr:MucR family transcriptional regulator [Rhodoblastus acidophilus]MCW2286139.1 putative transcriptional regulator [Rhodoblastus acidophilus]MCW2335033.1 putative transcriptional regulator [Rhodoblastus acidophilus]
MAENDNASLVAQILSSYLSNNTVAPADLPEVIKTVKTAFGISSGVAEAASEEPKKMEPAVSLKKSISPEALTCLCCGKPFKSLKRHLQSEHNMSPDEYRAAFGLKPDYPIVAPNYSLQRSSLAKSAGLGRKAGEPAPVEKPAEKKKPAAKKTAPKAAAE